MSTQSLENTRKATDYTQTQGSRSRGCGGWAHMHPPSPRSPPLLRAPGSAVWAQFLWAGTQRCATQGRGGQGQAGQSRRWFTCQPQPKRELPESRLARALPCSGYFDLTALKWPCTPTEHTSPAHLPTSQMCVSLNLNTSTCPRTLPEGADLFASPWTSGKRPQCSCLGQGLPGRYLRALSGLTMQAGSIGFTSGAAGSWPAHFRVGALGTTVGHGSFSTICLPPV